MGCRNTISTSLGPGSNHKGVNSVTHRKGGMFDRSRRQFAVEKVPGPGSYFQEGRQGADEVKDKFTFPRQNRVLPGDITRPDYDMSVFYLDKGPLVKQKIGGYTISNSGGVDAVADPSKKGTPGVGNYETKHAHSKTTFHRPGPSFSVPQAGSFSIEACLARNSAQTKRAKRNNADL